MVTEQRDKKFRRVAAYRQAMTVVLENVHDPHNIGAVLRTCDCVGIQEIYVLYTDTRLNKDRWKDLKVTSTGVKKWMHVHFFTDTDECFKAVTNKYEKIFATHLDKTSTSIYDHNLSGSVAFLFGNEHEGVSDEALKYTHGNILIPQFGMVQSLNISVACAITLYESARQRIEAGLYHTELQEEDAHRQAIYKHFLAKHK